MTPTPIDIARDGNLFPREDILEAVADSDWRDREVPLATWCLGALGLAALAAGLPVARIIVTGPVELAATEPAALARPVHALAAAIGATGIGIEGAFFLLSALAYGACLPAIGLALRAAGFRGRVALTAALVAVLSPLLVLHARLPTDAPFAVLGSSLCLAAVAAPADGDTRGERGYALRLTLALVAAFGLHRTTALLIVPMALALFLRAPRRLPVLLLPLALFAIAQDAGGAAPGGRVLWPPAVGALLAGGLAWAAVAMAWVRETEEVGPPVWAVVWLFAVTVPGAAFCVVPLVAVFVANALVRRARPDGALRWALAMIAGQLALAVWSPAWARPRTDSFAATGRGATRADDVVLVDEGSTTIAYLLQRRLGLRVVAVEGPSALAVNGRRILAVDRALPGATHVLDATTGEVHAVD